MTVDPARQANGQSPCAPALTPLGRFQTEQHQTQPDPRQAVRPDPRRRADEIEEQDGRHESAGRRPVP
ncbi:hypothetical protein EBT23_03240 [bacterium]|nr:hypothetical protein [bacterium]